MKDAKSPFLPAFFPRLLAIFWVVLLIGLLSFSCILGIAFVGPAMNHGTNVSHVAGVIVLIGPGKNFVLQTADGQRLSFQCGVDCHASLGHMQRHQLEMAKTDVYYITGPHRLLMAVDVD